MANKLILKNGAGVPAPEKLEVAELALDTEDGSLYSKLNDGTVVHLNEGGGSGGASVHIGEAPPADPQEGQQWLETPTGGDAKMWVYDGAVWLEQPSSGGGGGDFVPYEELFANEFMSTRSTDLGTSEAITDGGVAQGWNALYIANGVNGGTTSLSSGDGPNGENAGITTSNNWGVNVPIEMMVYSQGKQTQYVQTDDKFLFTGAPIQAPDFLDADGNSIVGAGGGDPEWAKVSGSGTAIGVGADVGSGGTSYGWGAYSESRGVALGWQAVATDEGAIAVGDQARAEYESAIAIGQNASCNGRYGIALGYQTQAEENQFTICDQIDEVQFGDAELRVRAVSAEEYLDADGFPIMRNVLSLSSMVDAFTTLQTAVADEDTLEGVKTALTNALGGLIEKFEAMNND